jgi:HEPN domain-containing protein
VSGARVIANLLRIAHQDLEGAQTLNARGNRNAIYLCEQAAEKLIRAVLTSERIHAGVRHQLDEMVGLIPDENPIKPRFELSSTSVPTRRHTDTRPQRGGFPTIRLPTELTRPSRISKAR